MAAVLTPWRWAIGFGLVLVVGGPLLLPVIEFVRQGAGDWAASDWRQVGHLFQQTGWLVAGTLALAAPIGVALAILLFRINFLGRRFLLACMLSFLFVPLPVLTSAWQALLGSDGWLHFALWGDNAGRLWTSGMAPAIWVHFLAGLPWVIVFVGLGLTWVQRELEEEMSLSWPPWRVLWRITVPQCRGAIVFAVLCLALQVAGEICVTDMMLVNTFAEHVQTQFTSGDRGGLARAVLAALPLAVTTWAALAWYLPRMERVLPPQPMRLAPPRHFQSGRWNGTFAVLAGLAAVLLLGVPLASLIWRLGQSGTPSRWSALDAWGHFANAGRLHGVAVLKNLLLAGIVGAVVSGSALVLCWLADGSRWFRRLVIAVLALAWSLPGPVVGIGLKETIAWLPDGLLADWFYYGPSPLPLAWAYVVRFLPFATALLWPIVRLVPREPCEAARLEGQGPWPEFRTVVWPVTQPGVLLCGVLVAALSLGEVAASARVDTPGWESFSKLLFDRMHYGVDNNVAALSVLLLVTMIACAAVLLVTKNPFSARSKSAD